MAFSKPDDTQAAPVEPDDAPEGLALATFAAGCFWGVEDFFLHIPGVVDAVSGYTGGTVSAPTYGQVCSGRTGHAEAVLVTYDPAVVSYETLLEEFFRHHDPTTPNRQGPDVGTQYRSAIFTHDADQERMAKESLDAYAARVFTSDSHRGHPGGHFLAGRGLPPAVRRAHWQRRLPCGELVGHQARDDTRAAKELVSGGGPSQRPEATA